MLAWWRVVWLGDDERWQRWKSMHDQKWANVVIPAMCRTGSLGRDEGGMHRQWITTHRKREFVQEWRNELGRSCHWIWHLGPDALWNEIWMYYGRHVHELGVVSKYEIYWLTFMKHRQDWIQWYHEVWWILDSAQGGTQFTTAPPILMSRSLLESYES